ncbi:MAG TPA: hypothetical protein VMS74_00785 [Acidimicrobiia bacterium]|nr:hypothetical protein [Acidimicrobiia bacterium]
MRTILVVANQTIGGEQLHKELHRRIDEGDCEFHVLVPVTRAVDYATALGGASVSGAAFPIPHGEGGPDPDEAAWTRARDRLDHLVGEIRDRGAPVTGALGDSDPFRAIKETLEGQSFDEIILSTLEAGVSRWLKMDLPSRLERAFDGEITTVIAGN